MEHRDYSGAIRWLSDRKVEDGLIADLFGKATSSVQVIAWRDANRLIPQKVAQVLSDIQAAGMSADEILADSKVEKAEIQAPTQISQLEEQIDAFGREFWTKVRDHRGAKELGLLLRKVSRPSWENIPLQRAAARLYHLLAELYLHAGCCRSSLIFSLKALRAEQQLYIETLGRDELFSIGKTSLLISQALINRSEYAEALPWINRSKQAFESGSHQIDPEAYKQLATVQFHSGAMDKAQSNYKLAGSLLSNYRHKARITTAEVKDIGERHLNLIGKVDWEKAFELTDFAMHNWPSGDIHKALNVNWAAAAALMTDSPEANKAAIDLLHEKGHLSRGYLHPETVTELLLMTPELPRPIRADWTRFSLHYNAFRNK
jgi:hypothetical protein